MTNKKAKKRSLSESDVAVKQEVTKKNKKENEVAVQNGQAKKEVAKKVNKQNKKQHTENAPAKPTTQAVAQTKFKPNKELKAEEIQEKIRLIQSRENLTKSAKRRLMGLKKLLRAAEDGVQPPKKSAVAQSKDSKKKQVQSSDQQQGKKVKPTKPAPQQKKADKKQSAKQGNLLLVKQTEEEAESDEEDEDEEEDEEQMDTTKEVDEDEEEDEEESAEEDEDDEDEEEEEETPKTAGVKTRGGPDAKKNKQNADQSEKTGEGKKMRYVLFVGNLPYTATVDDIKKHFSTKVSSVTSVRIPTKPGTNASRGFAYVELSNSNDYEKALSLHHSSINGRRINVQYSAPGSKHAGNKKDVIAKNQKLHALRKAGKLAGSHKNKKNFGKKGKQNAGATKT